MAFDAFEQFVLPGSNRPPVEGEDQAPAVQSPSAVRLEDEVVPEATEEVSKAPPASKP